MPTSLEQFSSAFRKSVNLGDLKYKRKINEEINFKILLKNYHVKQVDLHLMTTQE